MVKYIRKPTRFKGNPKIPGDKSISHRSLILGALADGRTEITDLLESEDVLSTARCLKNLGVKIAKTGNRTFVDGIGLREFSTPSGILDCGNSGTTIRLLTGVLAGRPITATLTGDASLVRRPMKRVAEPLSQMGANLTLSSTESAPITIAGASLHGINYDLKIASAQIKSAILLAALSAKGTTTLTGKIQSRDHTERMLNYFGVEIQVEPSFMRIEGGQKLRAGSVHVPGDPSTAAFWLGAASLIPGAEIEMDNIALNPTRTGFIRVLQKMGATVKIILTGEDPEPVGKIQITAGNLCGVKVTEAEVPSLIDEIPLLAVLASQASGVTEVLGAEELRVKESDRIEAMAQGLRTMGIELEVRRDGFRIEGPQKLRGASIQSFHDHRIAMAFSIAGLLADGETRILNSECANISYPDFFNTLEELTQE